MSARAVASLAVFVALVAASGFALAGVPNVELMTLLTFASGAVLGVRGGALCGALAMAIYSGANPYGWAMPPTFVSQILGTAGIGAAGGLVGGSDLWASWPLAVRVPAGAALGALLTLFYDFLTNFGTAVSIGAIRDPWPVIAGGIAFGVWHIVWNAAFFLVGVPPLLARARRWRERAW